MARKAHAGDEKNIKSVRWKEITRLIESETIQTQQDLLNRLNEQGYNVTQGTVSRDISELHLVKVRKADGIQCYKMPGSNTANPLASQFKTLFKSAVKGVDYAINMVVVKCFSGMADAICASLDAYELDGVLGTIAGDDTIFIVARSEEHARILVAQLSELL